MAHKTFISYKYSEAKDLRDRIIKALGDDAQYYKGENGFSPNMSDDSNNTIWNYLKDMIWGTTVTIVILSPHMTDSDWIDSEIAYSLKKVKRGKNTSSINGIVAVIKKVNGSCDWLKEYGTNCHGTSTVSYKSNLLFPVIYKNHFNSNPSQWHCEECKTYDSVNGSYIAYVDEDTFLENPQRYIENAFEKSQNDASGYDIIIGEK